MTARTEALQAFIDASFEAFRQVARGPHAHRTVAAAFAALQEPGVERPAPGCRLPICALLEDALSVNLATPSLTRLIDRFRAVEASLRWQRRPAPNPGASANFTDGHANAMIVGPGGLEQRPDVWLGATLMAPHVRYPDHDHPPEEVYLVLSAGEWRQGSGPWFTPGLGGSLYNEPGIRHAMRSASAPLFAFWVLHAGTEAA